VLLGGVMRCSCPAFTYRKVKSAECKHITEARLQRESGRVGPYSDELDAEAPRIDVVDIMAKAFQNGLESGFEMGRKMERRGLVR
jgi:predicted nucleic acid-binding Zn finger protein